MNYRIVKLDRRYSGSGNFEYRLEFPRDLRQYTVWRFHDYSVMRDWLWENYGSSCERELYDIVYQDPHAPPPVWCWHYTTRENNPMIYVADQATLAHLQLKWSA